MSSGGVAVLVIVILLAAAVAAACVAGGYKEWIQLPPWLRRGRKKNSTFGNDAGAPLDPAVADMPLTVLAAGVDDTSSIAAQMEHRLPQIVESASDTVPANVALARTEPGLTQIVESAGTVNNNKGDNGRRGKKLDDRKVESEENDSPGNLEEPAEPTQETPGAPTPSRRGRLSLSEAMLALLQADPIQSNVTAALACTTSSPPMRYAAESMTEPDSSPPTITEGTEQEQEGRTAYKNAARISTDGTFLLARPLRSSGGNRNSRPAAERASLLQFDEEGVIEI